MRKEQIVVGKSYVNEEAGIIREVVAEVDKRHVKANTFELATGKLVPTRHNIWNRGQLAHWAGRETTPRESARIHPFEQAAWSDNFSPPENAGARLAQAKVMLDSDPGYHSFKQAK